MISLVLSVRRRAVDVVASVALLRGVAVVLATLLDPEFRRDYRSFFVW